MHITIRSEDSKFDSYLESIVDIMVESIIGTSKLDLKVDKVVYRGPNKVELFVDISEPEETKNVSYLFGPRSGPKT